MHYVILEIETQGKKLLRTMERNYGIVKKLPDSIKLIEVKDNFKRSVKTLFPQYNKEEWRYAKILEVNLFAFAYRLFHEDFSSFDGELYEEWR